MDLKRIKEELMKRTKLCLYAALFSIGLASISAVSVDTEAAIVTESTKYKSEILYTKAELEKFSGTTLSASSVKTMYTSLCAEKTWTNAGYSSQEAKVIALDFSRNASKATSVLSKLEKNNSLYLKIVVMKQSPMSAGFDLQGDNGSGTDKDKESGNNTGNTQTNGAIQDLDIKIEYKNGDVEISYKLNSNGSVKKAKFENEMTGQKLEGASAQKIIEAMLNKLDVSKMSNKEIANAVTASLNSGSSYKKFQFKAELSSKSKIDFTLK